MKHLLDRTVHDGRPAHIVLHIFGSVVSGKVVVEHDLMNKAGVTGPVVFWQGLGEGEIEFKVGELLFQLLELIAVEDFAQ